MSVEGCDPLASENNVSETTLEIDTNGDHSDTASAKRSNSEESSICTPAKKIRRKPVPQLIENMKEYFDNSTLDQLTTTTLRHWLKERSIHCTTREKKENLIEKVRKQFLESTS